MPDVRIKLAPLEHQALKQFALDGGISVARAGAVAIHETLSSRNVFARVKKTTTLEPKDHSRKRNGKR